jgi:DNA replicative helicase MCM subunit Mcm2 (Cdc46/Mcm family)
MGRHFKEDSEIEDEIDNEEEDIQEQLTEEQIEETRKARIKAKNIVVSAAGDVDTWIAFIKEFQKDFEIINRTTKERIRESKNVYWEQLVHMIDKMHNDNNRFNYMVSANKAENSKERGTPLFVIDFADLQTWADKNRDYQDQSHNFGRLMEVLASDPDETLKNLKVAVFDLLQNIDVDFAMRNEYDLVCTIKNFAQLKEMPDLNSETLDRMYRVEGLIISYDDTPHPKIIQSQWECKTIVEDEKGNGIPCGEINANFSGGTKPAKCHKCKGKIMVELKQLRKKTDYIYLRLQQRHDKTLESRMSVDKQVRLEGTELVKYFYSNIPGSAYVSMTSIIRLGGRGNLTETTIDAKWMDVIPEQELIEEDEVLDEVVSQEIPDDQMDAHYDKICRSICHTIYGHQQIKEAIAIMLAGSNEIVRSDYSRIRGTISTLICGDSSEGKSDFIRFVNRVAARSVLAAGEDASAVGLTAGVNIDKDGIKRVSLGVCGLADNGFALIDELEKRDPKDFRRLSLCMDDNQQIIVRKAGLHRPIWARCSHLHVANPTGSGKWDPTRTIEEQTDFAVWLLRRYDFIFIVRDMHDEKHNKAVIDYIGKTLAESSYEEITTKLTYEQSQARMESELAGQFFSPAYLRHEFKYLKRFNPVIDTSAKSKTWRMIEEFWRKMKMMKLYNPNIDPEDKVSKRYNPKMPQNITAMDVRGIYSLVRTSRAVARLYRSPIVQPKHVERVINIMQYCITQLQPQESAQVEYEQEGGNEGNGHGLRVTTIQRDINRLAMREMTQQERMYQRKYIQMLQSMTKAIFKESFIKCGNRNCSGGQVVEIVDPVMKKKEVHTCGDCGGTAGEFESFSYADVEANLVESKAMKEKECRDIWNIIQRSGFIVPHGHGSKDYDIAPGKDPRSPDFVDTIAAISQQESRVEDASSAAPTMNRYTIIDMERESESEPEPVVQVEEYPKLRSIPKPIGKSDQRAETWALRELDALEKSNNNNDGQQNKQDDSDTPHTEDVVDVDKLDNIDLGNATTTTDQP